VTRPDRFGFSATPPAKRESANALAAGVNMVFSF
jgi:hypothetical protein